MWVLGGKAVELSLEVVALLPGGYAPVDDVDGLRWLADSWLCTGGVVDDDG